MPNLDFVPKYFGFKPKSWAKVPRPRNSSSPLSQTKPTCRSLFFLFIRPRSMFSHHQLPNYKTKRRWYPLETTKTTLCFVPNSSLAVNIVGRNEKLIESGQPIFIDRDPEAFKHVLNLLRDPRYDFPDQYQYELEYYGLAEPKVEVPLDHRKDEMKVAPDVDPDEMRTRLGYSYDTTMIHHALDDGRTVRAFAVPKASAPSPVTIHPRQEKETKMLLYASTLTSFHQ